MEFISTGPLKCRRGTGVSSRPPYPGSTKKTSVELDESKLELARRLAPEAKTMRELLDLALTALIQEQRRKSLCTLLDAGIGWEGDLSHLKKMRRSRDTGR